MVVSIPALPSSTKSHSVQRLFINHMLKWVRGRREHGHYLTTSGFALDIATTIVYASTHFMSGNPAMFGKLSQSQIMERLNSMPRTSTASTPFDKIHFVAGNGGWWAECPITGYGFLYKTLIRAISDWHVNIIAFNDGVWIAEPRPPTELVTKKCLHP